MNDNLKIWEQLEKTDPKHTKGFKRAGGFGGTAIKPIYTTQKMTEVFGPAGKGWGMGEPSFTVVPASEGQVAVYCSVSLWYNDPTAQSGPHTVYGVGGDMVVVKQSSGLRTDDEAFKKAFTDAVGNAMKHLGMSADVHMGLFDDSKYVREREEEERPKQPSDSSEPRVAPNSSPLLQDRVEKGQPTSSGTRLREEDEKAGILNAQVTRALEDAAKQGLTELAKAWVDSTPTMKQLPEKWELDLVAVKNKLKANIEVRKEP